MIVVCLAPFRDSGTKITIAGLGNSGVEWVYFVPGYCMELVNFVWL
jgi:hypothetical protein